MSNQLKEIILKVQEYFSDFTSFIELKDFRSFLLFTLTSQGSNVLAQMGLGGNKEIINLPYNPLFNIYFQKINLFSAGSLIVYVRSEPVKDDFIVDKNDPIFKNYLNPNELSLAFRGKEKFIFPKVSDCSTFEIVGDSMKLTVRIDDIYHSLESFIAISDPNIIFVIDSNTSEPDLLFAFNIMPQFPSKSNKNILKIDAYLDYDHKTKDVNYLKREKKDFKLTYLKDLKEMSHGELYKSSFSLVSHIKSLNKPY